MAAMAEGVSLNHIARATTDVKRLADFYQQILGFERIESPKFGEFEVTWLRLPQSTISLHLIERNPNSKLPEGPWSCSTATAAHPNLLPRGHHLSFSVTNFDSFLHSLKEKGIETFETAQPDGKTKQVFFFDPDVSDWQMDHDKDRRTSEVKKVFQRGNLEIIGNGLEVICCGASQQ